MAENAPLASFENARFFGSRPLNTGLSGTQTDLVSREAEVVTIRDTFSGPGGFLRDNRFSDGAGNLTLQPAAFRTAFHSEVVDQDEAIIEGKDNQEVQQNEFRGFGAVG